MSVPDTEPASCFVNANIWLYAFIEGDDLMKSACAKSLLEASRIDRIVLGVATMDGPHREGMPQDQGDALLSTEVS